MKFMLYSALLLLSCWLSSPCRATSAPSSAPTNGKWEDPSMSTTLQFNFDVAGSKYDITTVTFADEDDFSAIITVESSRSSWIGIMLGTDMLGSKAIIGLDNTESANAALGLQPVNVYNLVSQLFDTEKDCVPVNGGLEASGITDASFTVVNGRSILNFTITGSTSQNFPLVGNAPGTSVLISFVTGVNQRLEYHQGYIFRDIALASLEGGGANLPTNAVTIELSFSIVYHIIFMIMAWIFLLPGGATIALVRLRRGPKASGRWFKYHRNIQILGVAIGFGGWISGIIFVQESGSVHLSIGHHNFGYAIGVLSLIQVVNGLMRPHAPEKGQAPTKERRRWFFSHRSLGCILLLSGITNCLVGANILQDTVGGGETILVFPGASGISAIDFATVTLALGIVAYLMLVVATIVDPCRRRKERRNGTNYDDMDSPSKPINNNNNGRVMDGDNGKGMMGFGMQNNNNNNDSMFGGGGGGGGAPGYIPAPPPRNQPQFGNMQPPPRTFSPPPQQNFNPYGDGGGGGGGYGRSMAPEPNAGFTAPPPNAGFQIPKPVPRVPEPNTGFQIPAPPPRSNMNGDGYPMAPPRTMPPQPGNYGGGYPGSSPYGDNPYGSPPARPLKPPKGF